MESNKIQEFIQYLNQNNQQDSLSDYFTKYTAAEAPAPTIVEQSKPIFNTAFKIQNPIVSNNNVAPISNPNKTSIKAPKIETTIPVVDNTAQTSKVIGGNFKNKKEFIEAILPYAKQIAKEKGIDENIILSQAAFESGYGSNSLTKNANNIFSIQGKGYAHMDKNQQGNTYKVSFKQYQNLGESLRDWSNMVLNPNSKRYSKSYLAAKQNPEEFFKIHSWSGYAEGIGKTKEEAKQGIYKGYKSSYNDVVNLRKKYNI